ncbi:hypothetical protein PF005_g8166 [Phytophthora fragariae]|uniref:DUF1279 domain-containing protein n=1 Tax=Phytophthora fragariae TaxID=53985 RepID=A0A6A4E500_9STRA|nr:hypothetical protein PF003_g9932 [Phytophthora fragariae]KAE8941597.1 hypothetical protein PF009_g8609 [Phytophthora fragariae]KAE9018388.1 hypothetical protein PF011_g6286 [Phytophthora fragariae]KAE9119454.1 hypothetical protein PF007_g8537 [Phytophthora fragariae]KAE9120409.1 hypothetical protein PF010_g7499 [Phytophthora fragariae]
MLHSAALRSLLRSRPSSQLALRLVRPSSALSPLIAPRFGAHSSFAKSLQTHTFASLPSRDDELSSSGKSKKQQIQELLEQNAALKKEVKTLKEEVAKKPKNFLSTLQENGLPFLFWWTSLYVASGASIYMALDAGLISGATIIDTIMELGLDKWVDPAKLNPTHGNIAITVVVNEFLEVIRFPFSLATLKYAKRVFSRKKVEENK